MIIGNWLINFNHVWNSSLACHLHENQLRVRLVVYLVVSVYTRLDISRQTSHTFSIFVIPGSANHSFIDADSEGRYQMFFFAFYVFLRGETNATVIHDTHEQLRF